MVDTTAAMNPIVMASHGSRTADTETPTATPPASMHDCKWIWYRGSGALCFGSGLCYTRQKSVSGLFISMTEGTDHNSDHTGLNFPLGLQSTDAAAAVTALAARARYVLYTAAAFLLSFTRAELKLGQNIQRNTVPGEQRISQVIFCIADLQLAHFPTVLSATKKFADYLPNMEKRPVLLSYFSFSNSDVFRLRMKVSVSPKKAPKMCSSMMLFRGWTCSHQRELIAQRVVDMMGIHLT